VGVVTTIILLVVQSCGGCVFHTLLIAYQEVLTLPHNFGVFGASAL
jgi:hypothetical protein